VLRFSFVITISIGSIIYFIIMMNVYTNNREKYDEEACYALFKRIIRKIMTRGRVTTEVYGTENLPDEDGYIMFPNHQGKYDVLGVAYGHEKPCTFLIDDKRSYMPLCKQAVNMLDAKRIKFDDPRQQIHVLQEISEEVKNGRKYIIFPEGGYDNNGNKLQEFKNGCFKCAITSKCPIVPVTIIDSYKVFGVNSLKAVKTKVYFLKPIFYNEYEKLNRKEIADLVRGRIEEKLAEILGARVA